MTRLRSHDQSSTELVQIQWRVFQHCKTATSFPTPACFWQPRMRWSMAATVPPPQHRRAFMRIVCPCDKSSFFRSHTGAFKLALMGLGEARRVCLKSAGESERISAAAGTLSAPRRGRIRAPPLAGHNGSLAN